MKILDQPATCLEPCDLQFPECSTAGLECSAIGLDFGWELFGPIEAYGRGSFGALVESTSSLRAELGLRTPIDRHADIFAAYRWWQVEQEDLDLLLPSSPQELKLRAQGIVLGMALRF